MDLLETSKNIITIASAITALWKLFSFTNSVKESNKSNADQIKSINDKLTRDNSRIQNLELSNRHICVFLVDISNHLIDGNHVDKLKQTRDEVIDFLSEGGK